MRIRSLSDKIVLYFVIIGITAIGVVSTYSFITFKKALLNRTSDQLTSVRVVKKKQVERFFRDRLGELTLITHSRGISEMTNLPGNGFFDENEYRYLWEHLRLGGYYKNVYIRQKSGETATCPLTGNDEIRFQTYYPGEQDPVLKIFAEITSDRPYAIHDYSFDSLLNTPRMFISGVIKPSGTGEPMKVVLEISLNALNAIMLEQNPGDGLGLTGESYLVGSDNLMRSTSRFRENSIMQTQVNTAGVNKALNGLTGTSVIKDYRGIKVLSSYSKVDVQGLNWVILAEIDYDEATNSIYFIRNNILILTIFVAIVVLIISYIFSKRITLPLMKLTEATKNIRSGNLNIKLTPMKNDEIGQLTHSFNRMAKSLREKDSELKDERNKRFTAMIDGQELERQRLSRELHDGLGQTLIALKLKLEKIEAKDICKSAKTLKEVKTDFDDTINEIRKISNDLMPAVLLEFGLATALKNICSNISEHTKIDIEYAYSGKFSDLDDRTSIYLFRIVQEALNNVVKHAGASMVNVNLTRSENLVTLSVHDNGKGIVSLENNNLTGNGIPNMRERVRLLNGTIKIDSEEGDGTRINIEIPVKSNGYGIN